MMSGEVNVVTVLLGCSHTFLHTFCFIYSASWFGLYWWLGLRGAALVSIVASQLLKRSCHCSPCACVDFVLPDISGLLPQSKDLEVDSKIITISLNDCLFLCDDFVMDWWPVQAVPCPSLIRSSVKKTDLWYMDLKTLVHGRKKV